MRGSRGSEANGDPLAQSILRVHELEQRRRLTFYIRQRRPSKADTALAPHDRPGLGGEARKRDGRAADAVGQLHVELALFARGPKDDDPGGALELEGLTGGAAVGDLHR